MVTRGQSGSTYRASRWSLWYWTSSHSRRFTSFLLTTSKGSRAWLTTMALVDRDHQNASHTAFNLYGVDISSKCVDALVFGVFVGHSDMWRTKINI